MSKLSNAENFHNFWQELSERVSSVISLRGDAIVNINIDGEVYDNIIPSDIKKSEDDIYLQLTSKIKITIFNKEDYRMFFEKFFIDGVNSSVLIAEEEFKKVFRFYKEVCLLELEKPSRSELIKEGLARSGYKPNGKKADVEKHKRIRELASQNCLTKEEIARATDVGIATVYRVLKESK